MTPAPPLSFIGNSVIARQFGPTGPRPQAGARSAGKPSEEGLAVKGPRVGTPGARGAGALASLQRAAEGAPSAGKSIASREVYKPPQRSELGQFKDAELEGLDARGKNERSYAQCLGWAFALGATKRINSELIHDYVKGALEQVVNEKDTGLNVIHFVNALALAKGEFGKDSPPSAKEFKAQVERAFNEVRSEERRVGKEC